MAGRGLGTNSPFSSYLFESMHVSSFQPDTFDTLRFLVELVLFVVVDGAVVVVVDCYISLNRLKYMIEFKIKQVNSK